MDRGEGLSSKRHKPIAIRSSHQLIVEGKSDKDFFESFLNHLGINDFQIQVLEGADNLNQFLKAFKITPGFNDVKFLGIIRDSNDNPKGSFQSIQSALRNAELPVPDKEIEPAGEKPKVSILLIPGIDENGSLEDLCLKAVADDPAISCLEFYINCLKNNGLVLQSKISKAKLQAFLASRREFIPDLGIAAKKSIWPFDNEVFQKIRKLLFNIIES